jgi:MFS family permease
MVEKAGLEEEQRVEEQFGICQVKERPVMTAKLTASEQSVLQDAPGESPAKYPAYRWLILAAACLVINSYQIAIMSYAPLVEVIGKNLGVGLAQSVNLMSIAMLAAAISLLIGGPLCDRYGPATNVIISAVLSTVPASLTPWLGHSYDSVVLLRVLEGAAAGFGLSGFMPLVMRWFPERQRGIAMGIPVSFNSIGAIIGAVGAPIYFEKVKDWQQAVAAFSVFGWVALVFAIIIFSMAKSRAPKLTYNPDKRAVASACRSAIRRPVTWLGIVTTFFIAWTMQSVFGMAPSYFAMEKPIGAGLGVLVAGELMGAIQIGAIIGPIIGGILYDKLLGGRSRGVLLLGFFLSALFAAVQFGSVCDNRLLLVVCLAVSGAGIGMLYPAVQNHIGNVYEPQIVGLMNGSWLGLGAFGGAVGLFVNSAGLQRTGNYIMPINAIASVIVIGFVLSAFFSTPKRPA